MVVGCGQVTFCYDELVCVSANILWLGVGVCWGSVSVTPQTTPQNTNLQTPSPLTPMPWVFAGSPFKVLVADEVDPSKVRVTGPGVSSGVRARVPQSFTVDCSKAGQAPLAVTLTNPKGSPLSSQYCSHK